VTVTFAVPIFSDTVAAGLGRGSSTGAAKDEEKEEEKTNREKRPMKVE
jgi:hypothetical protein